MQKALLDYENALIHSPIKIEIDTLRKETWMNKVNPFFYKFRVLYNGIYYSSFKLDAQPLWLSRISIAFLISGTVLHGYGIILRMLIMGRPPVSTLYESIIFVSLL
ncbi:hypothetical protein Ct9H90mP29_10220 [bacterium]|nr:MAG: hypothetical protein Ct9H90mP29_10220 [bacterium]